MQQSTDTPQLTTDAPQVTVHDTLPPRRPFPAKLTARKPLSRDLVFNQGAYDEAHDALQRRDRIGQPAAWGAFRDDVPAGAA